MRRVTMLAVLAGLMVPGAAAAQERSVGDDLKNAARDAWFIVRSPVNGSAADWQTAGIAAGVAGLLLLVDEPIQEWVRENPRSFVVRAVEPFGEPSPLNLLGRTRQLLLPLSAVLYGAGLAFDSNDLRDAGLGCATSNLTTTLTRSAVSLLLGRLRPGSNQGAFVFEPFAFGEWEMRSFPGGHGANAMSCASYFNHRFDLGVAEPAIWATAAAISLARIPDEAHWMSDAFVGSAYGFAVGRSVAYRFLDRQAEREAERTMQPSLSIGWRIRF